MHRFSRATPLLDQIAETAVIAAWLAVPLFALLSGGTIVPPLHAAAIATLLTLALRGWRAAQRGKTLHRTREDLAAYLAFPARPMLALRAHRHRNAATSGRTPRRGRALRPPA